MKDTKSMQVIFDENNDQTLIFFKDHGSIYGINFHHGSSQLVDLYTKPDEELYEIFAKNPVVNKNGKFKKIQTARKAIEKYMVTKDASFRETLIEELVERHVNAMTVGVLRECAILDKKFAEKEIEVIEMTKKAFTMIYTKIVNESYNK